ncbi:RecA-family ATPase [Pseudaminobacter salicylatoxidans]|uniref:RecA-family ATPase n=1 Tax=Pseudaminobacter salicylatoxidans TaxID=93369 RepID=A0A316CA03_PSESE|nr:AAA family ATPase [Pseudaminobacter salicylatoxidans]PWJ84877.1 RecA-family ATPase [Pseudaminobacter salicylatoxidans]
MTSAQPRATPAPDSRESLVFGIYDRLRDHDHCAVDVVLVPTMADGEPDWAKADPANVEALPADEWPEDERVASRAAVLVDHVDGCWTDSSFVIRLNGDTPELIQIHGREEDRPVAEQIIARDIGAEPPVSVASKLQESLAKLTEKFAREREAANDNTPPAGAVLEVVDPADLADKPVPPRQWYVEGMIPARNVTLLSGDGGTGKSLLALQFAVAGALGIGTLGLNPAHGRTLVLAAEEELDELHRRLSDICHAHGTGMAGLRNMMRVIPAAGRDVELVRADPRSKAVHPTKVMEALIDQIVTFQPSMVVLDTSADLFGGDEINRSQVRQFVSMLRGIALKLDVAVLLLSHPSVAGMQTGTGLSGSTAWNNSVRSRLYLTADKDDEDARLLKGMKSNYGRKGDELKLRWQDGAFVLDDGKPTAAAGLLNRRADEKFRELLSAINRTGQRVAPTKGVNYAPSIMAMRPDTDGQDKKALEGAMHRLLAGGLIKVVLDGPRSKQRQRLIVTAEDFGPDRESEQEAA